MELVIIKGGVETAGYKLEKIKKQEIIIGRSSKADVRLFDNSVSRKHCKIFKYNQKWIIEDLGSKNGLIINGKKVNKKELEDKDTLMVGRVLIKVYDKYEKKEDTTSSTSLDIETFYKKIKEIDYIDIARDLSFEKICDFSAKFLENLKECLFFAEKNDFKLTHVYKMYKEDFPMSQVAFFKYDIFLEKIIEQIFPKDESLPVNLHCLQKSMIKNIPLVFENKTEYYVYYSHPLTISENIVFVSKLSEYSFEKKLLSMYLIMFFNFLLDKFYEKKHVEHNLKQGLIKTYFILKKLPLSIRPVYLKDKVFIKDILKEYVNFLKEEFFPFKWEITSMQIKESSHIYTDFDIFKKLLFISEKLIKTIFLLTENVLLNVIYKEKERSWAIMFSFNNVELSPMGKFLAYDMCNPNRWNKYLNDKNFDNIAKFLNYLLMLKAEIFISQKNKKEWNMYMAFPF